METMHEGSYVPVKKYENGKEGHYYCVCCVCGGRFIGDKRDIVCPRLGCSKNNSSALMAENNR